MLKGLFSIFKKKENPTSTEIQVGDAVLLSKSNFSTIFTKREILETDEFELEKVFIEQGKYFRANQTILTVGSRIHGSGTLFVRLPFGGRVERIHLDKQNRVVLNKQILSVTRIDNVDELELKLLEQNTEKLNQTDIVILTDDFSDKKTIKFTKVAGEETCYFKLYKNDSCFAHQFLGVTFMNHNGFPYLSFLSTAKKFSLAKGDSIIFLFENKEKLEFCFQSSSFGDSGWKSNHITLTSEHLNTFINQNLLKAKIISSRKNLYDIYVLDNKVHENTVLTKPAQYLTQSEGQFLLKLMAVKFIKMNLENKI